MNSAQLFVQTREVELPRRTVIAGLTQAVTLALCLFAQHGLAVETPAINAQNFELAPGLHDGLLTRAATRQDKGDWDRSWQLLGALHYTRQALAFVNSNGTKPLTQTVLGDLWMLDVGGSVGAGPWTFEGVLPVALLVRGGGPNLMQVKEVHSPTFGDCRIGIRRWLWQHKKPGLGRLNVAAFIGYGAATAANGNWLGSGGKQLDTTVLMSWDKGPWRGHLNLGARWRGRSVLVTQHTDPKTGLVITDANGAAQTQETLATGSQLQIRATAGRSFGPAGRAQGNLGLQMLQPFGDVTSGQQLLELYLDGSYGVDDAGIFRLFAGLSTATTSGYGSAQLRAIAGLRFVPGNLPSDTDGDGIDDRQDGCPQKAEDDDGFEDKDGCPEHDNDGDGITDKHDKCPLSAEDKDGFEDNDGCPDDDNDGDGIADKDDLCPNKPEDRDLFNDHDGCPDDDNDGDGIADKDDLCPNKPETRNKTHDRDGCPDLAKQPLAEITGATIVLAKPIRFGFRSAVLTADGKAVLDAVAALIGGNKQIAAVQVRAHTDDNGNEVDLQMLSKQRAFAIRDYLDSKRVIAAGKISAIGLGSSLPLTSNITLEGRTRNRRIELKLTLKAAPKGPSGTQR